MLGKELWSARGKSVVHLGMLFFTQDSRSHQDDITFLVRDPKLNLYLPLLLEYWWITLQTDHGYVDFNVHGCMTILYIMGMWFKSWKDETSWNQQVYQCNRNTNLKNNQQKNGTLIFTFNPLLWDRPDTPKSVYIIGWKTVEEPVQFVFSFRAQLSGSKRKKNMCSLWEKKQ